MFNASVCWNLHCITWVYEADEKYVGIQYRNLNFTKVFGLDKYFHVEYQLLKHFSSMFPFYTSGVFRGYKMRTLVRNGLRQLFWCCLPEAYLEPSQPSNMEILAVNHFRKKLYFRKIIKSIYQIEITAETLLDIFCINENKLNLKSFLNAQFHIENCPFPLFLKDRNSSETKLVFVKSSIIAKRSKTLKIN